MAGSSHYCQIFNQFPTLPWWTLNSFNWFICNPYFLLTLKVTLCLSLISSYIHINLLALYFLCLCSHSVYLSSHLFDFLSHFIMSIISNASFSCLTTILLLFLIYLSFIFSLFSSSSCFIFFFLLQTLSPLLFTTYSSTGHVLKFFCQSLTNHCNSHSKDVILYLIL